MSEFVIDKDKKDIVLQSQGKVERLFTVKVSFLDISSSNDKIWLGIKGDESQRDKAKDYINALTSPQREIAVEIPASLVSRLGATTTEHDKLEAEYAVVVRFPQETKAVISGDEVSVTLATSKLENLKSTLQNGTQTVSTNRRNLEEFALKLGYKQEDITAVFDKLGPQVDRNTFLSELIKISNQKSRVTEDRRSPAPSGLSRGGYSGRDIFRHPGEMVVSKGAPTSGLNTLNGIKPRGFATPDNNGVVSRGCVRPPIQNPQASSHSAAYVAANRGYMNVHHNNSMYMPSGNDFKQINSDSRDPNQEEQIFQQLLSNGCRYKQFPQSDLRHIVIDGSNVAMSHGNNKVFSCKGIALCVDWFRQRGHTQITVFVPQWRKESAKPESPITDQHYLNQLEEQGYLTFTPSRRVNGRRIICYDDRFVVRLAESTDGIIVSNDNFKDLAQENPKWKEVIERRLLMYSFVNDMFMPPDDPLGRHGPTLEEFLHKGTPTQRRSCPYGRRCTYGARCKYHHPEREDKRLQVYQILKDMFPSQDHQILSVMRKYPQEKDPERLALHILDMSE